MSRTGTARPAPEGHRRPAVLAPDGGPAPEPGGAGPHVLRAGGEIDLATAGDLRRRLAAAVTAHPVVVADLSAVTFLDCSGVRALTAARREAARRGHVLVVRGARPRVARVLHLAGVARHLGLGEHDPAGLDAAGPGASGPSASGGPGSRIGPGAARAAGSRRVPAAAPARGGPPRRRALASIPPSLPRA